MAPALLLLVAATTAPFPEPVATLTERCLHQATATGEVTRLSDRAKYICTGEVAQAFWSHLGTLKVAETEQTTPSEGVWASRYFPLGGCFKRVRNADGTQASSGLSCSIWVPQPSSNSSP